MANDTKKKFFIFALITGIFGYLAGILTAPKSGKETRKDIADKAGEIKESGLVELRAIEAELVTLMKATQDKAGQLTSRARAEYNEALIRAKDAQNKSKAVLQAVKSGSADNEDLDVAVKQSREAVKNLKKFIKS